MTPTQKAAATRKERTAAKRERFREQLAERDRIRKALNDILDDPDATAETKLHACELLKEYHY